MEGTKAFGKCVRSATEGILPDGAQMRMLKDILTRYPWFTTARILCSADLGSDDPALKLHAFAYPSPNFMLARISPEELGILSAKEPEFAVDDEDPIDKFLAWDGHRIVPDDSVMDEDASVGSARFDLTDDMVSEELAAIYLTQGLNREAKEIYQRLCLLNPEKSIYFAAIIEKITLGGDQRSSD